MLKCRYHFFPEIFENDQFSQGEPAKCKVIFAYPVVVRKCWIGWILRSDIDFTPWNRVFLHRWSISHLENAYYSTGTHGNHQFRIFPPSAVRNTRVRTRISAFFAVRIRISERYFAPRADKEVSTIFRSTRGYLRFSRWR